jgi:hypothetical protein
MNYNIYIDLDGVLSNFYKQFIKFTGEDPDVYKEKHGSKAFWDVTKKDKFWETMEWVSGGKDLWKFIKDYNPTILSRPGGDIEKCKEQKRKWAKRELGDYKIIFSHHKEKYASKDAILIDDMKENIDSWEDAGGIGILYTSASSSINKLKSLLTDIGKEASFIGVSSIDELIKRGI